MKDRLSSPIVWLAIVAQICIVITLFSPQVSEYFKVIGTSVIEICTLVGILNNPKDRDNF